MCAPALGFCNVRVGYCHHLTVVFYRESVGPLVFMSVSLEGVFLVVVDRRLFPVSVSHFPPKKPLCK